MTCVGYISKGHSSRFIHICLTQEPRQMTQIHHGECPKMRATKLADPEFLTVWFRCTYTLARRNSNSTPGTYTVWIVPTTMHEGTESYLRRCVAGSCVAGGGWHSFLDQVAAG